MHLREALLDTAEERFEPIDLEIGMDAALHEHAGSAHFDRLGNLFVDLIEVEQITLFAAGALDGRIKSAEGAVLRCRCWCS